MTVIATLYPGGGEFEYVRLAAETPVGALLGVRHERVVSGTEYSQPLSESICRWTLAEDGSLVNLAHVARLWTAES